MDEGVYLQRFEGEEAYTLTVDNMQVVFVRSLKYSNQRLSGLSCRSDACVRACVRADYNVRVLAAMLDWRLKGRVECFAYLQSPP